MNFFGHEPSFWFAVIGAAVFKVLGSQHQNWKRSLLTVAGAVFAAWVATDAVLVFMEWDAETYKAPTAAIIALVGENVMRWLINLTPDEFFKSIKGLRK